MNPYKKPVYAGIEMTPRKMEICKLLKEGLKNKEIADKLFICESSVKSHLWELLKNPYLRARGINSKMKLLIHIITTLEQEEEVKAPPEVPELPSGV